jgi:hypothetical protein
VDTFINYFQQNGGDGIMRASANRESVIRKMGTALSRQLRGMHIESKAVKSKQFDIGARQMSVNDGVRFANGSETNHDTIAWFVAATLAKRGADTDVV